MNKPEVVRTRMAQAHWMKPGPVGQRPPFTPAKFGGVFGERSNEAAPAGGVDARPSESISEVFWLDELLSGGIHLPHSDPGKDRPALTILVIGPPGTGKTTFVSELCYRWSLETTTARSTLYITTEAPVPWFINNALSFGWKPEQFKSYDVKTIPDDGARANGKVQVASAVTPESLKIWIDHADETKTSREGQLLGFVGSVLSTLTRLPGTPDAENTRATREAGVYSWSTSDPKELKKWGEHPPFAVVLDSLNTFSDRLADVDGGIHGLFANFQRLVFGGPRVAILVLDSNSQTQGHDFWEYACDIVVRLDRSYPKDSFDYLQRSIEIMKARYQPHAWGPHQYKIYEGPNLVARDFGAPLDRENFYRLQRAFPFRTEGGFFVLPSLHFLLSRYKRLNSTKKPEYVPTPIIGLSSLLSGQGFPRGQCTALMGSRGGHKSHLGLMQILSGILREELSKRLKPFPGETTLTHAAQPEKAIVISLRDDDSVTRKTLNEILAEWRDNYHIDKESWPDVRALEDADRLEIMYFPPGNITAEEFVHRVLVSVQRLKYAPTGPSPHVSLLFNSLDQLRHRFPLCYRQNIFISGLIQILSAEAVTSVFVTATGSQTGNEIRDTSGEDASAHGLDSIAELILRFRQNREIPAKDYVRSIGAGLGENAQGVRFRSDKRPRSAVVVEVERFAGGQAAGGQAILELVQARRDDLQTDHELWGFCQTHDRRGLNAFLHEGC